MQSVEAYDLPDSYKIHIANIYFFFNCCNYIQTIL